MTWPWNLFCFPVSQLLLWENIMFQSVKVISAWVCHISLPVSAICMAHVVFNCVEGAPWTMVVLSYI